MCYFSALASFHTNGISRIPSPRSSWTEISAFTLLLPAPSFLLWPNGLYLWNPLCAPPQWQRRQQNFTLMTSRVQGTVSAPFGQGGLSSHGSYHALEAHPEAVLLCGHSIIPQKFWQNLSSRSYFSRPSSPFKWSPKLCSLLFWH